MRIAACFAATIADARDEVDDPVVACLALEDKDICICAAHQRIVASPSVEAIGTNPAYQKVLVQATDQPVVAHPGIDIVGLGFTDFVELIIATGLSSTTSN